MRHSVIESLMALGGKKNKKNSIDLLSTGLVIKCKESGFKYTIKKVVFEDGKPIVSCYRQYGPEEEDIVHVTLQEKDFENYEAA